MKKYALGVHHVNVAYTAGNVSSYHRQIREGIEPLFDLLYNNPTWCFTIEMSGFSVEFIGENYPAVLQRLLCLIERKQIEFISCTYSPQIWISFPRNDMIKSIELNLKILDRYSIKPSRLFFTQENFSGEGMKELSGWFDTAIIKDDYYYYLHEKPKDLEAVPPYYMLDNMKVLIGWGHILEHVGNHLFGQYSNDNVSCGNSLIIKREFSNLLTEALDKTKIENSVNNLVGKYKELQWTWYHIGSSERFGKPHMRPENIETCRFNPQWFNLLEQRLKQYESQGYIFTGIQKFIDDISCYDFKAEPILPLLDGAWNMERSKGGFIWTGLNNSSVEDDLLVRNQNWRSRTKLIGAESLLKLFPESVSENQEIKNEINKAWQSQLMAEASDSTGWYPNEGEVFYGIEESENVLNYVQNIVSFLKVRASLGTLVINTMNGALLENKNGEVEELKPIASSEFMVSHPILFGGEGEINYYNVHENIQRVIIDFIPVDQVCGVYFNLEVNYLLFSPALMDDKAVSYSLKSFKPEIIYLPLPNGLICIKENFYVIKHNEFLNIACCINREESTLCFKIENPRKSKLHWVLTLFNGELDDALYYAQSINISPKVYL